jgi:peptide/nickel transport system permease protein
VLTYALQRLVALVLMLLGISLITFILLQLVPGDPASIYYGGQAVSEEALAALRQAWGLDRPLPVRYLHYVAGLVQGNLGVSTHTGRPVLDDLLRRVPASLELALVGVLFAVLIGLPLGVLAALRRDTVLDHLLRVASLVSLGVPSFWLGLVIIYFFSFQWSLLPPRRRPLGDGSERP